MIGVIFWRVFVFGSHSFICFRHALQSLSSQLHGSRTTLAQFNVSSVNMERNARLVRTILLFTSAFF